MEADNFARRVLVAGAEPLIGTFEIGFTFSTHSRDERGSG